MNLPLGAQNFPYFPYYTGEVLHFKLCIPFVLTTLILHI